MNYFAETQPETLAPLFASLMNQINQGANMDCTEELKTLRDLYAKKITSLEADLNGILPTFLAYSRKFAELHAELDQFQDKYDALVEKLGDEEGEE